MRLTAKIKRPDKEDLIVYTKGTYEDTIPAEMTKNDIRAILKKLADYEDAEEQGLLLRLPCKVGDSVYRFWYVDEKPYKVQTQVIRTLANLVAIMESGEFGKSVFFSLEEAEAKLKEMEGESDVL